MTVSCIFSTGRLSISVECCGSCSVISFLQISTCTGDRLYISARLNEMYPTAPSGQIFPVLVAHNVLLQTTVALALKYLSVQACNADFFLRYHKSDHIRCCVSGFIIK